MTTVHGLKSRPLKKKPKQSVRKGKASGGKKTGSARPEPKPIARSAKLGVDAGSLTVADMGYLLKNGANDFTPRKKDIVVVLDVPKGRRSIRLRIKDSGNGPIDERFDLAVPSGRLFVGDASFVFTDAWTSFLKKTKYLLRQEASRRSFDLGSDGVFDVRIEVS
jgi:hypothetical protein